MNTTIRLLVKDRRQRNGKRNHRHNERPSGPLCRSFCRCDCSQFTGHLVNLLQALDERQLPVEVVGNMSSSNALYATSPQFGSQFSKAPRFVVTDPSFNARIVQKAVVGSRFVHVTPISGANIGTGERYLRRRNSLCGTISVAAPGRVSA